MCMRVFDVPSWNKGSDADAVAATKLLQLSRARTLCKSYRVPYSRDMWLELVEAAVRTREKLLQEAENAEKDPSRSAGDKKEVDNRKVWTALLPAAAEHSLGVETLRPRALGARLPVSRGLHWRR